MRAIQTLSADAARYYLMRTAAGSKESCAILWDELTVDGKDVVRYHADTESEDGSGHDSDEEEEEGTNDASPADGSARTRGQSRKPVAVADEEKTPRYANCENCEKEFTVSINKKGDCIWHRGRKEIYYDGDFWADHDENCHGDPHSFEDDPDFAEGFRWTCCHEFGDNEGCKSTKHKADSNVIVEEVNVAAPSRKRKAEEEIRPARWQRCFNCEKRYDVNNNWTGSCVYHPGSKEVSNQHEFWCDHDDECHGRPESFIDDPEYAAGFAWRCCGKAGDEPGCATAIHIA